jgi:hypothetical protein
MPAPRARLEGRSFFLEISQVTDWEPSGVLGIGEDTVDFEPDPPRWRWTPAFEAVALMASLASGSALLWWTRPPRAPPPSPAELEVFRAAASGPERLAEGSPVSEGDTLQLAYRAHGERYGAILSLDGRGVITRSLPLAGQEAVPLEPEGLVPLQHALSLDDAPSFERFFLVTADSRFPLPPVERALQRGEPLPTSLRYEVFEVQKH